MRVTIEIARSHMTGRVGIMYGDRRSAIKSVDLKDLRDAISAAADEIVCRMAMTYHDELVDQKKTLENDMNIRAKTLAEVNAAILSVSELIDHAASRVKSDTRHLDGAPLLEDKHPLYPSEESDTP